MLNMVAERFGVHANHGGNRFECMPLHVVTKKVGKNGKVLSQMHDVMSL